MAEHLTTETIAAYLSNRLPELEQSGLETHLAACRECRQEVMSARRLLETRPVPHRWQLLVPAAAAAVLALTLVGRGLFAPPRDTVRAADPAANAVPSLHAVGPANQATVDRSAIVFTWTGAAGRPLYRLTLTDGSGRTVWTRNTDDTTTALPADVGLAPNSSYFWYVDALDSAGQSLTTGTRQFSTPP